MFMQEQDSVRLSLSSSLDEENAEDQLPRLSL
jgi:hypothetical protein